MNEFLDQFVTIGGAILLAVAIIVIISVLTYLAGIIRNNELSDQFGWRNFKKPIIGLSLITATILAVVLVILVLIGGLN